MSMQLVAADETIEIDPPTSDPTEAVAWWIRENTYKFARVDGGHVEVTAQLPAEAAGRLTVVDDDGDEHEVEVKRVVGMPVDITLHM